MSRRADDGARDVPKAKAPARETGKPVSAAMGRSQSAKQERTEVSAAGVDASRLSKEAPKEVPATRRRESGTASKEVAAVAAPRRRQPETRGSTWIPATASTAPAQRSPQQRRSSPPLSQPHDDGDAAGLGSSSVAVAAAETVGATTDSLAVVNAQERESSEEGLLSVGRRPRREPSDEAEPSAELDSFDEEIELLKCEADLVAAAADIATTSADDDGFLTTDADLDDEDDGLAALPSMRSYARWQGRSVDSVVIEEDEEDMSSGVDDVQNGFEVGSSEIRSRLWAQSLLRLKRSIDEIYSLCEFESDEMLCGQVRSILDTASEDFQSLLKRLDTQQEYTLMAGEYPFKSAVAWTTRTPRTSNKGTSESALEQLEKQLGSPTGSMYGRSSMAPKKRAAQRRSRSFDPTGVGEDGHEGGDFPTGEFVSGGSRESESVGESYFRRRGWFNPPPGLTKDEAFEHGPRGEQLHLMVEAMLQRVNGRNSQTRGKVGKPCPEDVLKRSEDRQRRAQQLRASQEDLKMTQIRQADNRMLAAKERRQEREQTKQSVLLEKMSRSRRQYQDQLRIICQRARKENRKAAEVRFIAQQASKDERQAMKQRQENAIMSRALMKETMRKKLLESANRVAKVSENRRRELEKYQYKLQQDLEEKERLAAERRREHIDSIRLKSQGHESRKEAVLEKRQEIQDNDERTSRDFMKLRSKHSGVLALNCDGLPEGVRQEVVEQLHSLPPSPQIGRNAGAAPKFGAQRKSLPSARATTPPRGRLSPTVSSPPSAVAAPAEFSDGAEMHINEVPAFPGSTLDPDALASAQVPGSPAGEHGTSGLSSSDSPSKLLRAAEKMRTNVQLSSGNASTSRAPGVSESSNDEPFSEVDTAVSAMQSRENQEPAARPADTMRTLMASAALSDEDALRLCDSDGSKAAPATAAHRTRISKLAADLGKVLSNLPEETPAQPQPANLSINLERADTILADFCKVLGQTQRESDFVHVLKLGCAKVVVEICVRIKDSLGMLSGSGEQGVPPAWKQTSNVMLNALKWLALLSNQQSARTFLLLTNRVLSLADVAMACLQTHFRAASPLPEAQSVSVLFLPQVLHILSLHINQAVPEAHSANKQTLVSYCLISGLAESIQDLFTRAEIRGTRLFEGASSVPLLLLRAMGFLGALVNVYHLPADADRSVSPVLKMFRRTELFGIVGVLLSILLSDGRQEKSQSGQTSRFPQTVTSLAAQAVKILNDVARIDLKTLQETLGAAHQIELYHLLVWLLDFCLSRLQTTSKRAESVQDDSELLHSTIALLGSYCLQNPENQGIMCYGEGQTLLAKITSLPLHYFMDERYRPVLFPTILATCFGSQQNLELLRNEMNLSLLQKFLATNLEKIEAGRPHDPSDVGFGGRFPVALWREAHSFFSDGTTPPLKPPSAQQTEEADGS